MIMQIKATGELIHGYPVPAEHDRCYPTHFKGSSGGVYEMETLKEILPEQVMVAIYNQIRLEGEP